MKIFNYNLPLLPNSTGKRQHIFAFPHTVLSKIFYSLTFWRKAQESLQAFYETVKLSSCFLLWALKITVHFQIISSNGHITSKRKDGIIPLIAEGSVTCSGIQIWGMAEWELLIPSSNALLINWLDPFFSNNLLNDWHIYRNKEWHHINDPQHNLTQNMAGNGVRS